MNSSTRARRALVAVAAVVLAAAGLAVATPAAAAPVSITIHGTVVDAVGVPAAGVTVSLSSSLERSDVSTGDDGTYSASLTYNSDADWVGVSLGMSMNRSFSAADLFGLDEVTVDFQLQPTGMVTVSGVVVDSDGAPIPGATVTISGGSVWQYYPVTAADGTFSQAIRYEITPWGGMVYAYYGPAMASWTTAELAGVTEVSAYLQTWPTATITVSGYVGDIRGKAIADTLLSINTDVEQTMVTTDARGYYTATVVGYIGSSVCVSSDTAISPVCRAISADGESFTAHVIDGADPDFTEWFYEDPSFVTVPGEPTRVFEFVDLNGDYMGDELYVTMSLDGLNHWSFVYGGWGGATEGSADFSTGNLDAVYVADLDGDGAVELIARSADTRIDTWWIYDFATGAVTTQSFGRGDNLRVGVFDIDGLPGRELVAYREKARSGAWWIYDYASDSVERVTFGAGAAGVPPYFADIDGLPGMEIVAVEFRKRGPHFTEYYTRGSGVGEVVRIVNKNK